MVVIKKERWTIPGTTKKRYIYTARDEKGKFLGSRKVTKDFPLARAKEVFSKNNTFKDDVRKIKSLNFNEYTTLQKGAYAIKKTAAGPVIELKDVKVSKIRLKQELVQWMVTVFLKNGTKLAARSKKYFKKNDLEEKAARQEAWDNILRRLADSFGLEYEPEEGERIFESRVQSVQEGRVYYEPRQQQEQLQL